MKYFHFILIPVMLFRIAEADFTIDHTQVQFADNMEFNSEWQRIVCHCGYALCSGTMSFSMSETGTFHVYVKEAEWKSQGATQCKLLINGTEVAWGTFEDSDGENCYNEGAYIINGNTIDLDQHHFAEGDEVTFWSNNAFQCGFPQPGSYSAFTHLLFEGPVDEPLVLTSLTIEPAGAVVAPNQVQQFSSTGLDQYENPLEQQPSVAWSVDGGGAIDENGLFTAFNANGGPFTVTVSSGDIEATTTVTVEGEVHAQRIAFRGNAPVQSLSAAMSGCGPALLLCNGIGNYRVAVYGPNGREIVSRTGAGRKVFILDEISTEGMYIVKMLSNGKALSWRMLVTK